MLKTIKILIAVGFIAASLTIVWSQQSQPLIDETQTQTSALIFEVSTDQNHYLLREPISLNLRLSNQTDAPLKVGTSINLSDTNFIVLNEAGETVRWEMRNHYLSSSIYGLIQLHKGQKRESDVLLDGKMAEKIFPRPGRYEVLLEYVYYENVQEPTKVISNRIIITIREPQGINKQAYNFLTEVYEPARQKSDIIPLKHLRQNFVNQFPNSVYAKYLIVELAKLYYGSENDKALRELCKIHNVNFHHSKQVKSMLLEVNAKLHPVVLSIDLPEDILVPITIKHPCTGQLINPHNF